MLATLWPSCSRRRPVFQHAGKLSRLLHELLDLNFFRQALTPTNGRTGYSPVCYLPQASWSTYN
jgi:hypothetical protein